MLDQIIQFAKDQMGDQMKNEHALSEDQQNGVYEVAQSSLFESIKTQITGGSVNEVLDVFNGNSSAEGNAVSGGTQSNVVQNLMDKFGFDSGKAGGIAATIIPVIMKRFSSPESGNADTAEDLVKKFGLDGDSGVASIISKFSGDGGIGNLVKGMLDGK